MNNDTYAQGVANKILKLAKKKNRKWSFQYTINDAFALFKNGVDTGIKIKDVGDDLNAEIRIPVTGASFISIYAKKSNIVLKQGVITLYKKNSYIFVL